jgi:hypothetical protein
VHVVQQGRQPLHLVHDHPVSLRDARQLTPEQTGVAKVGLVQAFVEEVESRRIGEALLRPGALPDAAHAEEEEAAPRQRQQPGIGRLAYSMPS